MKNNVQALFQRIPMQRYEIGIFQTYTNVDADDDHSKDIVVGQTIFSFH